MIWKNYSKLKGQHAFLSPSQHAWLNYSSDKLVSVWANKEAIKEGTELHEYACMAILKHRKQVETDTVSLYINDCIDNDMTPEQTLYYSQNCFGTADAINYTDGVLKIFDLKTGTTKAAYEQLYIYAALFCLDYDISPFNIDEFILRIYQYDGYTEQHPEPDAIVIIMNIIKEHDEILSVIQGGAQ